VVRVERLSRDDLPHSNAMITSYDILIVDPHFVFSLLCCVCQPLKPRPFVFLTKYLRHCLHSRDSSILSDYTKLRRRRPSITLLPQLPIWLPLNDLADDTQQRGVDVCLPVTPRSYRGDRFRSLRVLGCRPHDDMDSGHSPIQLR